LEDLDYLIDRRTFLRSAASAAAVAGLCANVAFEQPADDIDQNVSRILSRIHPPQFPNASFNIEHYGASREGKSDSRPAIAKAISECHAAGGGRVIVPSGTYLSNGPLHLLSNVNLHLEEGATIRFGTNPKDYLPVVLVRWESTRCYNYSPLIYANGQENIAITGAGTFDGQAQEFWGEWKSRQTPDQNLLRTMGTTMVPLEKRVFGEGHFLRPTMCEFYDCRNILLEGVTLKKSPFWTIHPVFCTNVTVRKIRVEQGTTNDDGCDPDSCRDVLIEDCTFNTADDNIAIKAGRDQDAWGDRPCENIVIRRCSSMNRAFAIGSEMSGSVRNVFLLDCTVGNVGSAAIEIKCNSDRGGAVENVWVRGLRIESCDFCVRLSTTYKGITDHPYPPQFRNFSFEDIVCRNATQVGISSLGNAVKPIEDVHFKNVTIEKSAKDIAIANTRGWINENVRVNGKLLERKLLSSTGA
jgi:polygalacturonase